MARRPHIQAHLSGPKNAARSVRARLVGQEARGLVGQRVVALHDGAGRVAANVD